MILGGSFYHDIYEHESREAEREREAEEQYQQLIDGFDDYRDQHTETLKRCVRHAAKLGYPSRALKCTCINRVCGDCPELPIFLKRQAI